MLSLLSGYSIILYGTEHRLRNPVKRSSGGKTEEKYKEKEKEKRKI